jgi:signal transduction histidine kinase
MLSQMLDIERLEDGRLPVDLGAVNMVEEANTVLAELADLAAVRGIRFEWKERPLPMVLADAMLLRRILRNMLINAIRHSHPKGTVTLETRVVELGVGGERTAGVEITIRDRGAGVPAEYATKIFEKFGAANLRMNRGSTPSVGLGLPFCRLAARAMFGEVNLKETATVDPTGSVFSLQLRQA